VDHVETARDWCEAGGSEHRIFTAGLGDRSAEYPAYAVAADGGDKEVVRLLIESEANVGAPQRSSEDMERCSGQSVDVF